jgi:glutamine amidotransferase PdxT
MLAVDLRSVVNLVVISAVGSNAVRRGNVLAACFHPELTPDWRVHRMFVDMRVGDC